MVLKRIGPLSLAKILAILYALSGVIIGFFMWMFSSVMSRMGGPEADVFATFFGVGSIIFFPILYGILGFIFGLLTAWLYNIIAERIGGVELEFEEYEYE